VSVPGGFSTDETLKNGMRPTHVTAAINVPASYYLKIWRQLNPTPAGQPPKDADAAELKKIENEERKRIEDAIVNLLPPPPAGKTPYPLVTVTTYVDTPSAGPPAASLVAQTTDWLSSNWRTIAMLGIGLIGLMMLRGMLRNAAPPPVDSEETAESHDSANHGSEPAEESDKPEPILVMRRKMSSKGPNLREELRQLVKDDPDAAANVLRGWIGDAA
jgi:flagellar M-ring protein FliF